MLQRASEAIDRPRYDDIELAPAGFLVHGVEAGGLVAALGNVELWNSKGGLEQLVYKTHGFQTRQLAEAWIVPVEVQSGDPPEPRARVTYLKPRRSRVVIISKPNPLPPLTSPPALPDS